MGTISSSVGLLSGFPIQDTVDKLVKLQAAPRDSLAAADKRLQQKQAAYTKLTALVLGLQFSTNRLATSSLYGAKTATASSNALSVTVTGDPAVGVYQFRPLRRVQAQQFTSGKLASDSTALGGGTFAYRFGGYVDSSAGLDLLNQGNGFDRGKIKITDRSGASTVIDLSLARTVDDVLDAINQNTAIRVSAKVVGDRFRLIDNTGASANNLKVEEVDGGATAQSLGLAGINVAASQANGGDVVQLFNDLSLSKINHGLGARFDAALPDLQLTFRDGTSQTVDFRKLAVSGTTAKGTTNAVNANSRLTITATKNGSTYVGAHVVFQNDNGIAKGSETVSYDANSKTLTFRIKDGESTADDAIAALTRNTSVSALFSATRATGSNGTGLVHATDTAELEGPQATAITQGSLSAEAKLLFTAVHGGGAYDGVTVKFVANGSITKGAETVVYDDSNPNSKTLTFQIAAGATTGNDIVNALNNDPIAGAKFRAARASGATGNGLISVNDTGVTAGGAVVEPIPGTNERTIGDILATLNAAAPAKFKAEISPDGDHLLLTDLTTSNGGTFAITSINGSKAAEDLGLTTTAAADKITGRRLLAGLKTSLLSTIKNGTTTGALGGVAITDRSGASATVSLASAETIDDVISLINNAGIGVVAAVNQSRTGIRLTDTTGSNGNLIVANADGTNSADRLGITGSAASSAREGANLHLAVVNQNTTLASLNGGSGVQAGSFKIFDTTGASATFTLTSAVKTIGDLTAALNNLGLNINAKINDNGDGITLVDTAHGSNSLRIESGTGATAANLHLLNAATTQTIGGQPTQVIDASTTTTITLAANETLRDLVKKINDADSGVQATLLNDGSGIKPFRLSLNSKVAGLAGKLLIDSTNFGFELNETAKAQDALLEIDAPGSTTPGVLASSSTNSFKDVLEGATININSTTNDPVTVSVARQSSDLSSVLIAIVDAYNRVHNNIQDATAFDADSGQSAILQGDGTVLRVDSDLSRLVTGRYLGLGAITTLAELGVNFAKDGTLSFDQAKFDDKFAADPDAVKKFLSTEKTGISDRFKVALEQIAGEKNSLLGNRNDAAARTHQANLRRLETYGTHLESVRTRLLLQFQRMEQAIAKFQSNLRYLSAITSISPAQNSTPSISLK